jgi:hypothetical protein
MRFLISIRRRPVVSFLSIRLYALTRVRNWSAVAVEPLGPESAGMDGEREAAAGGVEPDRLVFIDKAKTWRPSNLSLRPKPRALSPQPLLNRFQPVPESAIYGADFSWRDSSRGDVGQYSALKHCDLV